MQQGRIKNHESFCNHGIAGRLIRSLSETSAIELDNCLETKW